MKHFCSVLATAKFYTISLLFYSLLFANNSFASLIFINEIHYDNVGSDINEKIELIASAGTSTEHLSLRLYNGGNSQKYAALTLPLHTFSNDINGYGFLVIDYTNLQNGPADGIALFENTTLLQFISYEGVITVNDDLLTNVTSHDIGVYESSATPITGSLQLINTGRYYHDFIWSVSDNHTFGRINEQQFLISVSEPPFFSGLVLGFLYLIKRRKL